MERKCSGAHNVQIFGLMCGTKEICCSQGGAISVQEYVSIRKFNVP